MKNIRLKPRRSSEAPEKRPEAGEVCLQATHGIATVEIALDNILYDRPEISIILLETILIFCKKPLEIMEKNPIEDRTLWVMLMVDPCHNRDRVQETGQKRTYLI